MRRILWIILLCVVGALVPSVSEANLAGRTLVIETPRIFLPMLQPSRYKGLFGGRGGAKSHQFAELLIERHLNPTRSVCIREVQRSLEQSVKRLLEDKIKTFGLTQEFKVMNTHIVTPGDGIIIFEGMQNHTAESIKSLEGFDIAWCEEAQSISQRSLDLLRPTIRRPDSEIWFSWNPRNDTDPVDALLRSKDLPPGSIVIETNWKDNPWFPDVLRKEMEWDRSRDNDKYQHVWGGGYEKQSEARVFKNWKIEEFDTPKNAHFLFGSDWGYSVDPAVLVRMFIEDRKLYIDREAYEVGCEIDALPTLFDGIESGMARAWEILADSARPETISYMQRHGYPKIRGAKKGPDSVKEGVIFIQSYDVIIHPRCIHTIDEFKLYSYVVDKLTKKVLPILEDKKNHVIDSVRYGLEPVREPVGKATW